MHITAIRPAQWPRHSVLPAKRPQAAFRLARPAELTPRELRRIVADMID